MDQKRIPHRGYQMLIGYARVSTDDQKLDLQVDALKRAGCERIYQDVESGSRDDRGGLADAMMALQRGDTLMVWKLDRLGRSLRHLVDTILALQDRGVNFRALSGDIDTSTTTGRLVFHIFASLAEFERDVTHERTMAGLAAARARGRVGGRRPLLTQGQIERAKAMLAMPDHNRRSVAQSFNVSRSTLRRALLD